MLGRSKRDESGRSLKVRWQLKIDESGQSQNEEGPSTFPLLVRPLSPTSMLDFPARKDQLKQKSRKS